jgi:hypothetical protein
MEAEMAWMEGAASMTAGGGRKKEYTALLGASEKGRSGCEGRGYLKWEAKGGQMPPDASSCCTSSTMRSSALASRQEAHR